MIQIQNLTKSYGQTTAIKNLNFSVKKGEVVGFLGPNGAGKSTTMKIITGYMAPTSGSVKVAGFDVFENPLEVKKRIGFLPETPPLYTDMLVKDYLAYVARLKGIAGAQVKGLVEKAMKRVSLVDVQSRLINNLSKGYKQRVGLAQALVSDPEILILDEPTVGLDPKQVAEIRDVIKDLAGHHTVILSTHILPEVQMSCERVIIINRGSIVAEDTLKGLSEKMANGGRKVFVKVRNISEGLLGSLKGLKGVLNVSKPGGDGAIEIDTEASSDMQEAIAAHVVTQGAGLVEIRSMDLSLEDIFLKVTSTGAQGGM